MGTYLAHPSIKAEAKAGSKYTIPFVSNSLHLPIFSFYLLRPALCLDTPSFTSHPMVDQATKRPMEESLEVVPARPRFRAMLR
jgi:hypothetical protein